METTELFARLLDDARRYDPAAHARGLLAPYREVLLLQRAKYMSYEQIAATLTRHGLKVSPAGVGVFCRRTFTRADIEAMRRHLSAGSSAAGSAKSAIAQPIRDAGGAIAPSPHAVIAPGGKRGPKIARDNY